MKQKLVVYIPLGCLLFFAGFMIGKLSSKSATPDEQLHTPQVVATSKFAVNVSKINASGILGKPVNQVQANLGNAILVLIPPTTLPSGGDVLYRIGQYVIQVAYDTFDENGVARILTVTGMSSDEMYSLQEWNIVLSKFGINGEINPDHIKSRALFWENNNGHYVVFSASEKRDYLWTLTIAEPEYKNIFPKHLNRKNAPNIAHTGQVRALPSLEGIQRL